MNYNELISFRSFTVQAYRKLRAKYRRDYSLTPEQYWEKVENIDAAFDERCRTVAMRADAVLS